MKNSTGKTQMVKYNQKHLGFALFFALITVLITALGCMANGTKSFMGLVFAFLFFFSGVMVIGTIKRLLS